GAHGNGIEAIAFSPSPHVPVVAMWSRHGALELWNTRTCTMQTRLGETQPKAEQDNDWRLHFASNASKLLTAGDGGAVRVWAIEAGKQLLLTREGPVSWAEISDDGMTAVSARGNTVSIWNTETGARERVIDVDGDVLEARLRPKEADLLLTLADKNPQAQLWSTKTGKLVGALLLKSAPFSSGFSPDGSLVTIGTIDGEAAAWHVESRRRMAGRDDLDGMVISTSFVGSSGLIVSTTLEGRAEIWDSQTGSVIYNSRLAGAQAVFGRSSADGAYVALPAFVDGGALLVLKTKREHRAAHEVAELVRQRGRVGLVEERVEALPPEPAAAREPSVSEKLSPLPRPL
ncbi:MAG: repeat, subgroup, partial [Myxococcaceae bacterium]|nr:repeat, subgroup [Myxococcaceae bacterium]